ncbi:sensor histidine kinase [Occultella kanbiaonis]|uniref:sensor histidine kinase n=1 Tax=Occultella kanbiaonis TaxID=2675754 RepID=UPI0013D4A5FB|nr:histidine kinase [Occultella kanbiaonis]
MGSSAGRAHRVHEWARQRPLVVDSLLALVLAATAGVAAVAAVLADPPGAGYLVLTLAAFLVLHLAVAVRRVRPVVSYVSAAVSEAALALVPLLSADEGTPFPATLLPAGIAYLVCAYSVSAWGQPPWPRRSLLIGAIGAAAVTLRWVTGPGFAETAPGGQVGGTLFVFCGLLAVVTAAWGMGAYRLWQRTQIADLAERARRAEQDRTEQVRQAALDERARIAREMHDVVAHSLSVMVRQAEGGRFVAAADGPRAAEVLRTIADTGREALQDMRSLLGVLRTDEVDRRLSGIETPDDAPQPTIDDVPQLVERLRDSGLAVELTVTGRPRPLDRAAHLAAYRLVQESLTNVVKHAGDGASATVRIDWGPEDLVLQVTDSGQPPPPTVATSGPGRGQVGMAERLALLGGTLNAGPATDGGYRVSGRIPWRSLREDA